MGKIFNIQRFSTSDGVGIRTVVFMKGCPLSCVWCHNPESKSKDFEIFYNPSKCINCGNCHKICDEGQHIIKNRKHIFLREDCKNCMKCALGCVSNAIEVCGKEMTAEEILKEVLRDKEFYEQSRGGLTLSGGEPLMQYDFSMEILKKSKEAGINTAVETSGYSNRDLTDMNKYVDLWLYDIKLTDEKEHIRYTGVSNEKIIKNLYLLNDIGGKIIMRCPVIPDINLNVEHFEKVSLLANKLENVIAINFEPYHPLGIDKSYRLGKIQEYKNKEFLSAENVRSFVDGIKNKTKAKTEIL